MKGLIKKDLALVACNIKIYLIVILIGVTYTLISMKSGEISYFFSIYIIIILTFAGVGTIAYDEQEGGMGFLMTLPIVRSTYVMEKFLFCILCDLLGWAISMVLGLMIYLRGDWQETESFLVVTLLYAVSAGILTVLMIPLRLRFGAESSRIVLMGVGAGIAAVAVAVGYTLKTLQINVAGVSKWLTDVSGGALLAAFTAVFAVGFVISYFCSLRVMKKKEF